jgi:hypothetical protein
VDHYSEEDWQTAVSLFEEAVAKYTEAEAECRLDCEKPFDMGWFPDFVTSVASTIFTLIRGANIKICFIKMLPGLGWGVNI